MKRPRRFAVVVVEWAVVALLAAVAPAAEPQPDINQPITATRSRPVTYDAEFVVAVTAPYHTKKLRVWLPLPPSDLGQEFGHSELTTFPRTVTPEVNVEPLHGNRFAYFEFADPQGAQIIRHRFRIKVWELRWQLDPAQVQSITSWPERFAPYLRSESQAVVADDRFGKLLSEIVPRRGNPLVDLRTVMNWAERNLTYDHDHASLAASSVHALTERRGHCSDYHGFCAALGRVMSQPTRVTYGMNAFAKSSPSHCKLEAFIPPYGWVSFDVSETQKLAGQIRQSEQLPVAQRDRLIDAAHRRLTSGFRDNTWFVQTRGSDYDLVPKASRRVAVVRTIYAEADDQPLAEPDPSDRSQSKFAWMTAHRFVPDSSVTYPFTDPASLQPWLDPSSHSNESTKP